MPAKKNNSGKNNTGQSYQSRYEKRVAKAYTQMLGEVATGAYAGPAGARRFESDMKKEGFKSSGDYSKSNRAYGPDTMVGQLRSRVQKASGDLSSARVASRAAAQEKLRAKRKK